MHNDLTLAGVRGRVLVVLGGLIEADALDVNLVDILVDTGVMGASSTELG